jgi:hypothetical protein
MPTKSDDHGGARPQIGRKSLTLAWLYVLVLFVSETSANADRREQILGEVAEGLHAVFKETQRRAMEAEDTDEFVRLAGALSKLGRGLRQSLALHARFEKERRDAAAEAADGPAPAAPTPPADPRRQAIDKRKAFITRGVERCVWNEYDDDDADDAYSLLEDLSDRLDDLARQDAFLDADIDALIAQFCREIGVDPPEPPTRAHLPAAPAGGAEPPASAPRANGHLLPPANSS